MEGTDLLLAGLFQRRANLVLDPAIIDRFAFYIDHLLSLRRTELRDGGTFTEARVRTMLCAAVILTFEQAIHPRTWPTTDTDGNDLAVQVTAGVELLARDIRDIRRIDRDDDGRVRRVRFRPECEAPFTEEMESLLRNVVARCWPNETRG